MLIARTVDEVRSAIREVKELIRKEGREPSVGFVPTMGYLHEGHASLMRRAHEECEITVLSIFVNPLQFGPNEDFSRYPRDEARDLKLAEENGVDVAFLPDVSAMYPNPVKTRVTVSGVTELLCGASRPGHFDGVGLVVSKLFNIVQPDKAYFGLKDAQQVAVIEQMTADLSIPVDIVPCPIIREPDGLALSSRNVYLSDKERRQALVLSQSLERTGGWLKESHWDFRQVKARIENYIRKSELADIDYVELMEYPSIRPVYDMKREELEGSRILVALAVRFGKTRLIDNRLFQIADME
jgi:pantoate--beta-alanine ligase